MFFGLDYGIFCRRVSRFDSVLIQCLPNTLLHGNIVMFQGDYDNLSAISSSSRYCHTMLYHVIVVPGGGYSAIRSQPLGERLLALTQGFLYTFEVSRRLENQQGATT